MISDVLIRPQISIEGLIESDTRKRIRQGKAFVKLDVKHREHLEHGGTVPRQLRKTVRLAAKRPFKPSNFDLEEQPYVNFENPRM